MPSPTTINRRAREYGGKLKQFLPDCVADTDADAVIPDGTKRHSQGDDCPYHSVQATLGEDTAKESRSLLDLSVNADWDEAAAERLMVEISKRWKNRWMRWTEEGIEALLQLRLVKYADPDHYQAFLDELLQRSIKTAINCDLSVGSASGKL